MSFCQTLIAVSHDCQTLIAVSHDTPLRSDMPSAVNCKPDVGERRIPLDVSPPGQGVGQVRPVDRLSSFKGQRAQKSNASNARLWKVLETQRGGQCV